MEFVLLIFLVAGAFIVKSFLEAQVDKKDIKYSEPRTRGAEEQSGINYHYELASGLMTPTELKFFRVLESAVDTRYYIFSKVRLEDIITVKKGLDRKQAYGLRSRIKSRHIDFVLCHQHDLSFYKCIELDDSSHGRKDRIERDKFVNEALRVVGLALVRIPVSNSYSEADLKSQLGIPLSVSNQDAAATAAPDDSSRWARPEGSRL